MTQAGTLAEAAPEISYVESESEVAACYGLMRQLRPHLVSEHEFIERWRRQTDVGYRLLAIWKLVLDTPLTNTLGHRFYYREGLLATALRFNISLV